MRKLSALIGILIATGVAVGALLHSGVETKHFYDPVGILIVVGGTFAAIFITYSLTDIVRLASICSKIFFREDKTFKVIVTELMKFSEQCYTKGIPAETKAVHPFLNECISLLGDGYSESEMRDILEQRITSMYEAEKYDMTIIRAISKYPPAFGMFGTAVGLVALMSTIGSEAADMKKIGAYMAIALTATLYGLLMTNFIFKPISENLEIGTKINFKTRQIIMETILLIRSRASLLIIEDTINSLIPPRERVKYIGGRRKAGAKRAA